MKEFLKDYFGCCFGEWFQEFRNESKESRWELLLQLKMFGLNWWLLVRDGDKFGIYFSSIVNRFLDYF